MDYFSPEENEVFAVARQLLEAFVQSRPGYQSKVNFAFFAAGASHMRMSLQALPQSEAVFAILYHQWLIAPNGASTCTLTAGESASSLTLNFRRPVDVVAGELREWLSRGLAQAPFR